MAISAVSYVSHSSEDGGFADLLSMEDREAVSTSTWRLSELMFRLIIVIVFVAVVGEEER